MLTIPPCVDDPGMRMDATDDARAARLSTDFRTHSGSFSESVWRTRASKDLSSAGAGAGSDVLNVLRLETHSPPPGEAGPA